jgi:hypothetical protein
MFACVVGVEDIVLVEVALSQVVDQDVEVSHEMLVRATAHGCRYRVRGRNDINIYTLAVLRK